jgi:hypothetical protein
LTLRYRLPLGLALVVGSMSYLPATAGDLPLSTGMASVGGRDLIWVSFDFRSPIDESVEIIGVISPRSQIGASTSLPEGSMWFVRSSVTCCPYTSSREVTRHGAVDILSWDPIIRIRVALEGRPEVILEQAGWDEWGTGPMGGIARGGFGPVKFDGHIRFGRRSLDWVATGADVGFVYGWMAREGHLVVRHEPS